MWLSLLCVDVLQYFMYTDKIQQHINTKQTQPFYKNTDMSYFMGSCFFCLLQFINYFTFVTDSDWSSEQPVSDFFSYCPFQKRVLK